MNKDRHLISELNSFFAESNNTKAIQGIMNVMSHITLNQRQMDFSKATNCKFTASQVLTLMACSRFSPSRTVSTSPEAFSVRCSPARNLCSSSVPGT